MPDSELTEVVASSRAYHMTINLKLSGYKAITECLMAKKSPKPSGNSTPGKIVKLPLPPIQIQTFENNSENPFSYYTFKKSFKNAIAGMSNLTGAQNLIYLKGYLTGEALNLVENIPMEDDSFDQAVKLLDINFMEKELVIDKTFISILSASEVGQMKEVESFIRLIINKVYDLKGVGVIMTEENSRGLLLLSKIINLKLPRQFLIELEALRERKSSLGVCTRRAQTSDKATVCYQSLTPPRQGLISHTCLWGRDLQQYRKSFRIGHKPFYNQVNDKEW